ncbi:MAG: CDGSH iron-sulfur domain-containing protein [Candidatus Paceibacterota bacterium]|jgi:CDGSH-type Zn-finger protein
MEKNNKKDPRIKIMKNGPYKVTGGVPMSKQTIIADEHGYSKEWEEGRRYPDKEEYYLCRCGRSGDMPYCDKTHEKVGFDGSETASRKKYIDCAEKLEGPDLVLTDREDLCVSARFCDRFEGTWELTAKSDDPGSKKLATEQACNCPGGRLVAWDKKTKKAIEPDFKPSIGLVEDPEAGVSGPIWARGGIPVEGSDGKVYEVRNRVTLCRCGRSKNRPFCDGRHKEGFSAGI